MRFGHSVITGLANVQQRPIQAIEDSRDWKICNRGKFEAISKAQDHTRLANNFWQRLIQMHSKCMGAHRNTQERRGIHRITQERTGKTNNVWQRTLKAPHKITNKYALTLFCFCFWCSPFCTVSAMYIIILKTVGTPKFITQNKNKNINEIIANL